MSNNWKLNTFSGLVAGLVNDIALYASDSKKIIMQNKAMGVKSCTDFVKTIPPPVPSANRTTQMIYQSRNFYNSAKPLFRGLTPVILTGTGPSLGIFFLVYSTTKNKLTDLLAQHPDIGSRSPVMREIIAASLASTIASVPTSISIIPSDVLKKAAVGSQSSRDFRNSVFTNYKRYGLRSFFVGWQASLAKDIPLAFIKMPLYVATCEAMWYLSSSEWYPSAFTVSRPQAAVTTGTSTPNFSPIEVGIIGAVSGGLTAFLTMPMDAVNTRMKSPNAPRNVQTSYMEAFKAVYKTGGPRSFFAGTTPRVINFALGSAIFWLVFDSIQKLAINSPLLR